MIPSSIPWEKIKRIALLGTDRSNLPAEIRKLLSDLDIDLDQKEDKILLDGLTKLAIAYRAGRKFSKTDLEQMIQPISGQVHPPPIVAQMLPIILHGNYRDMLSEYLNCLQLRGWTFPPDQLPHFLETCIEEPILWEEVADFIGPTAHKLIELNKDWHALKRETKEKNWKSKFPEDRIKYFRYIRNIDPYSANEILTEEWSSFSAKFKESLLNIISENIQAEDAPFIAQLPIEKSKKVAIAKFKIEAQLTASALSRKATLFLQKNLLIKKKLTVSLPELSDAQEIGLIAKHPEFGGGLKANYLAQIIFSTPLEELEKIFAKSPADIVKLFSKNEWGFSFLEAIILRIKLEKNQKWIAPIFNYYLDSTGLIPWDETYMSDVFKILDEKTFVDLINIVVTRGPKFVTEESPLIELVYNYPKSWPNEATFSFFKLIKGWLKKNPRFWESHFVWEMLQHAGFMVDPIQLGILQKAFESDPIWGLAEDEINKFLEVVSFRYRLYKPYP